MKDFHIHTTYCDGKNTPEEFVLAAIEKSMEEIGFSGHSYISFDDDYCMTPEKEKLYFDEIGRLKEKYKDKIKIYRGIEQDSFSPPPSYPYDYVIGSVHYLKCGDSFPSIDLTEEMFVTTAERFFGGDFYALVSAYFSEVTLMVKKLKPDIIGHFDLVTKYNEGNKYFFETDPKYESAYKKAVDTLIPYNIPFEINTGAVSRGYRSVPYPSPQITTYIKLKGGRFILSSDSHSTDTLCYDFDKYKK